LDVIHKVISPVVLLGICDFDIKKYLSIPRRSGITAHITTTP
jgi:hypothetical protein